MEGRKTSPNKESAPNAAAKPKRHIVRKIVGIVLILLVALLVVIFFTDQDYFYEIAGTLLFWGLVLLSIIIIIAPFWYTRRKYKKFTPKNITISILISFGLIILLTASWLLLLFYSVSAFGRGLLQTF